jgi:hypothetical protein
VNWVDWVPPYRSEDLYPLAATLISASSLKIWGLGSEKMGPWPWPLEKRKKAKKGKREPHLQPLCPTPTNRVLLTDRA